MIQVGKELMPLPQGVSIADWALERVRYQNPRIRAFLGCVRLLGEVLESNYAILHCSPDRLREIWRKVREVASFIRIQISPLLEAPSLVPGLETARCQAQMSLRMLNANVLAKLDQFPEEIPEGELLPLRKLLCISIGEIHAFLQDTFGELMAGDPRSLHDADYFLSRRFPQDIEEAEWLHSTVVRLQEFMNRLDGVREQHLSRMAKKVKTEQLLPGSRAWLETAAFLNVLQERITPKLKEVLALRGVRFYEMEILDRYAVEIPAKSRLILELYEAGQEATERLKTRPCPSRTERERMVEDLVHFQSVVTRRIVQQMTDVDRCLRDLHAFIPLWLQGIERRRALMLRRQNEENGGMPQPAGSALGSPKTLRLPRRKSASRTQSSSPSRNGRNGSNGSRPTPASYPDPAEPESDTQEIAALR